MKILSSFLILIAGLFLTPANGAAGDLNFKLKPLEGKGRVELAKVLETGPVLVAFWATWCHPCQDELVQLQKIYEAYQDSGLSFFAISIDDAKTASKVKTVASGKRLTIPILLDPEQEAMQAFGLSNVPGVFIVGKDGKLLYQHTGYKPGDEAGLGEAVKGAAGQNPRPKRCQPADSSSVCDTTTTSGKEDK
ncbi:TlpA family protein disulfide reductase [candidate division TA06 bacterium]|nr:TlpA family protein disulfide reductase [candidate division TA06 bacterium]